MNNLTMTDVKRENKKAGRYWFTEGAIKFFNSKIESKLLNQKYFVTSERFEEGYPRLYTIRAYNPKTHQIDTVGEFQQYKTKEGALVAIGNLS